MTVVVPKGGMKVDEDELLLQQIAKRARELGVPPVVLSNAFSFVHQGLSWEVKFMPGAANVICQAVSISVGVDATTAIGSARLPEEVFLAVKWGIANRGWFVWWDQDSVVCQVFCPGNGNPLLVRDSFEVCGVNPMDIPYPVGKRIIELCSRRGRWNLEVTSTELLRGVKRSTP